MFPVLLQVGDVKIYSYGFFTAVGYISALLLGRHLAKARGLDTAPFMDLAFIGIASGVLGARLFFVLQNFGQFSQRPKEIFEFWNGGLVFYGGFLLATVACVLYGVWKKMPLWQSTDIVVTGVAFAHGFGRIGCFAAGCCHGSFCAYPWGVHNDSAFVDPALRGQPLHPVQLYESFALFLLTGLMAWLVRGRKVADGTVAMIYLAGYAFIRFVMEMFRGDRERGFLAGDWISTSQGIALVLFMIGGGVLVGRLRRVRRNH